MRLLNYSNKKIKLTPFGIDVNKFRSFETRGFFDSADIVIGTIKSLEYRYGIDYLLKTFAIIKTEFNALNVKLLIVGTGVQEAYLKKLSEELGINSDTVFAGYINYSEIPRYHNMIDIFCALSLEESFGVSILEACACEKPVVVSDAGGLPEVVEHKKTGLVVKRKDPQLAAEAISTLIKDECLRKTLGKNGRKKVITEYKWEDSVAKMVTIYNEIINKN